MLSRPKGVQPRSERPPDTPNLESLSGQSPCSDRDQRALFNIPKGLKE